MNILIHGFNVKDPYKSIGKLEPHIKNSHMFNYGHFNIFDVLRYNKREAQKLMELIDVQANGVNVIAHSNGCAIAVEAARLGGKIKTLICINPALNSNLKFPASIERIVVIHTKHDKAVKAARFFDAIPLLGWFVPDIWGAMGATGAVTGDSRLINIDSDDLLDNHSDLFTADDIQHFIPIINSYL